MLLISQVMVFGQLSEGGLPYSFYTTSTQKSAAIISSYQASSLDIDALITEDTLQPEPMRYMVYSDAHIDIKAEGTSTELTDKNGTLWQYQIESHNALSLQLVFSKFYLPQGATLYLYNSDFSEVYGAYTYLNNRTDSTFRIADFVGNSLTIEYFEPNDAEFSGILVLNQIGQAYRSLLSTKSSIDDDGYVGVNCPEGKNWQNQKHSVCLITFEIDRTGYICSGALINNVNSDGTPYFLTANHCISEEDVAETVTAVFNYEQTGCNNDDFASYKSLSGATLKTTGENSDYTLLLLDETPTATYKPYYSGWNISTTAATSTTGIHHPEGNPKKMSFDYNEAVSYSSKISWDEGGSSPANTHWEVVNDLGITAGGSSGSPLFNQDQQIVGQLHGGGDDYDFYGKLSYSWTNPDDGYETLKSYLDPSSTNVSSLVSYYPSKNMPDPKIFTDFDVVCTSAEVPFYGVSAFSPTGWVWSFSPSTVTFLEGTSSSSQNPIVSFNDETTYSATLVVTNAGGRTSTTSDDIITAGTNIDVSLETYLMSDSCLCNTDSLNFIGYGASTFQWTLNGESANYYTIDDNTANPVTLKPNTTTLYPEVELTAIGYMGTCSSTIDYSFSLIYQENDSVQNATQLTTGTNGTFSNKCATIEDNEPQPSLTSCTGQKSWCDEYSTGDALDASVWFYFEPSSSGTYSLTSNGFDNQMAIYQADDYSGLFNSDYTIIAANDDYSLSNYNAIITSFEVTKNKTYWIQVDGSGGGAEGDFTLTLENLNSVESLSASQGSLLIYPQPASDNIYLACDDISTSNTIIVSVYSLSGSLIYTQNNDASSDNRISIDLQQLNKGIYLIQLVCDQKVYTAKMIKQ